ncbi:MAG TPA: TIGR02450 family Trp-rich protein, partial [Pseudomonas sp.]|nr:TIGR02450 family Trp-rich protein [Pseudomonas sp.]
MTPTRLNPRKLLLSKWTARAPQNRERHFLVTELHHHDDGRLLEVDLQA